MTEEYKNLYRNIIIDEEIVSFLKKKKAYGKYKRNVARTFIGKRLKRIEIHNFSEGFEFRLAPEPYSYWFTLLNEYNAYRIG